MSDHASDAFRYLATVDGKKPDFSVDETELQTFKDQHVAVDIHSVNVASNSHTIQGAIDAFLDVNYISKEDHKAKLDEAVEQAKLEAAVIGLNWCWDLLRQHKEQMEKYNPTPRSREADEVISHVRSLMSQISAQETKARQAMKASTEEIALKEAILELQKTLGMPKD